MSVPVESDIAPIAQLLLYAILPDGEVFGDFAKYEVENCLPNKVGDLFPKIKKKKRREGRKDIIYFIDKETEAIIT